MQSSLLQWVRPSVSSAFRFLVDVPEFMLPNGKTTGPFRKGDLVSRNVLPTEVWNVLISRRAVEKVKIES